MIGEEIERGWNRVKGKEGKERKGKGEKKKRTSGVSYCSVYSDGQTSRQTNLTFGRITLQTCKRAPRHAYIFHVFRVDVGFQRYYHDNVTLSSDVKSGKNWSSAG